MLNTLVIINNYHTETGPIDLVSDLKEEMIRIWRPYEVAPF